MNRRSRNYFEKFPPRKSENKSMDVSQISKSNNHEVAYYTYEETVNGPCSFTCNAPSFLNDSTEIKSVSLHSLSMPNPEIIVNASNDSLVFYSHRAATSYTNQSTFTTAEMLLAQSRKYHIVKIDHGSYSKSGLIQKINDLIEQLFQVAGYSGLNSMIQLERAQRTASNVPTVTDSYPLVYFELTDGKVTLINRSVEFSIILPSIQDYTKVATKFLGLDGDYVLKSGLTIQRNEILSTLGFSLFNRAHICLLGWKTFSSISNQINGYVFKLQGDTNMNPDPSSGYFSYTFTDNQSLDFSTFNMSNYQKVDMTWQSSFNADHYSKVTAFDIMSNSNGYGFAGCPRRRIQDLPYRSSEYSTVAYVTVNNSHRMNHDSKDLINGSVLGYCLFGQVSSVKTVNFHDISSNVNFARTFQIQLVNARGKVHELSDGQRVIICLKFQLRK